MTLHQELFLVLLRAGVAIPGAGVSFVRRTQAFGGRSLAGLLKAGGTSPVADDFYYTVGLTFLFQFLLLLGWCCAALFHKTSCNNAMAGAIPMQMTFV